MESSIPFIDLHVHADCRSAEEFPRLLGAGCRGLLAVSGPGCGYRSADSLLDHFRRLDRLERRRLEDAGLRAWVGIGVHPGGIPERELDRILADWGGLCTQYHAAAIGEVGLQAGTEAEERILARAFEVAAETNLPVIVHTPRRDKAVRLARILSLLRSSPASVDQIVLDHLDEAVLPAAKDSGCWLGLSVHPAKLAPELAADLVARHGPERMLINSDMGANPSHLFAIPATRSAMLSAGLAPEAIREVLFENPQRFLGDEQ